MKIRTRVKFCGLTRPQDVQAAVDAGADAIGLVFYPASSRALTVENAALLRQLVPAFVDVVALFVNADQTQVKAVIDHVKPDLLQFHGDETPAYCQGFHHRYLRSFRVGAPGMDSASGLLDACKQYPDASGWLFDSYSVAYGGSGLKFDTELLADVQKFPGRRPLILAGGLAPQTVTDTLAAVRPYAVDVSSGVETSPGIKCPEKLMQFMSAVQHADFIHNKSHVL